MHVTILVVRKRVCWHKDSLPIKIRGGLSFDECIVAELRFGQKKIFFTALYRNPMHKTDSPELFNFIENLGTCIRKFVARNHIS